MSIKTLCKYKKNLDSKKNWTAKKIWTTKNSIISGHRSQKFGFLIIFIFNKFKKNDYSEVFSKFFTIIMKILYGEGLKTTTKTMKYE